MCLIAEKMSFAPVMEQFNILENMGTVCESESKFNLKYLCNFIILVL